MSLDLAETGNTGCGCSGQSGGVVDGAGSVYSVHEDFLFHTL